MAHESVYVVAVVGAGPAGLFAARALAANGCRVLLLNRDIKPGGLAEYGIFLDKYKMKGGLRRQFQKILTDPRVTYFGNVTLGQSANLAVDELDARETQDDRRRSQSNREGFRALTCGAAVTRNRQGAFQRKQTSRPR